MDDTNTPVQLTYATVAYALMFYGAATILLLGLVAKIWTSLRDRAPQAVARAVPPAHPISGTIKLASDVVLFRSTFFTDRWAWMFSMGFHFGLLLVLIRHLRYALDPAWVGGIFWKVVVVAQPFGLYGGLALIGGVLGFLARHFLIKEVREETGWVDRLLLVLLLAIPVVGYLSELFHTDVVAVKDFFVGLATGHWKPLPTDWLLLTHLWLVAVMITFLPFGKMLHLGGVFDEAVGTDRPVMSAAGKRLKLAATVVLGVLLIGPAVVGVGQVASDGWTKPQADYTKLVKGHRRQDPTVMIRNHPNYLMHKRNVVVYTGTRSDESIERCVTCHAKEGADGQPIDFENPNHFCTSCHNQAAVTIDCFECHSSKPIPEKDSLLERLPKFAAIENKSSQGSVAR